MKHKKFKIKKLEEKHREAYLKSPVNPGEFSVWEDEKHWGAGFQTLQSRRSFGVKKHASDLKE
jgi:hypothetical protein